MLKDYFESKCEYSAKRVKERSVRDALNRVREWRRIYEQGKTQENQKKSKVTLQEAAKQVKTPKKTLEDYVQIFNKIGLIFEIEEFKNKRMGFLRTLVKRNKARIRDALLNRMRNQELNLYHQSNKMNVKQEEPFEQESLEQQVKEEQEMKEEESFEYLVKEEESSVLAKQEQ